EVNASVEKTARSLSKYRQALRGSTSFSALLRAAPLALAALSFASAAQAQESNWSGGDGNWNDATKWSAGAEPNATTNPAKIGTNAAGVITLNDANNEAMNVTVGGGSTLQIVSGGVLTTNPAPTPPGAPSRINTIGLAGVGSGAGTMLINGNGSKWNAGGA